MRVGIKVAVSGIMLTLLLTSILTVAFYVQPVKADETVCNHSDGSVDQEYDRDLLDTESMSAPPPLPPSPSVLISPIVIPLSTSSLGIEMGKEGKAEIHHGGHVEKNTTLPPPYNSIADCLVYNPMSITKNNNYMLQHAYNYFTNSPGSDFVSADDIKITYYCNTPGCPASLGTTFTLDKSDLNGTYSDYRDVILNMTCPMCSPNYSFTMGPEVPKDPQNLSNTLKGNGKLLDLLNDLVGPPSVFSYFPWGDTWNSSSCPKWTIASWNVKLKDDPIVFVVNLPIGLNAAGAKMSISAAFWNSSGGYVNFTNPWDVRSVAWCAGFKNTNSNPGTNQVWVHDTFWYKAVNRLYATATPSNVAMVNASYNLTQFGKGWVEYDDDVSLHAPLRVNKTGGYWKLDYWNDTYDCGSILAYNTSDYDIPCMQTWHNVVVHYKWVDNKAPYITYMSPVFNATNVPINSPIAICFSEPMDVLTVQNSFSLSPNVTGSFIWTLGADCMVFKHPYDNFQPNTTYEIGFTSTPGATDLAGNHLIGPFMWPWTWFTTGYSTASPPSDMHISRFPYNNATCEIGGSTVFNVTISSFFNFSSPVSLSLSGLPEGFEYSFDPNPATPPANESIQSTLTVFAPQTAELGQYNLTITGVGGDLVRQANATLEVTLPTLPTPLPLTTFPPHQASGLPHDIAISDMKPSKTVVGQGYSVNVDVVVENQGFFNETFNITLYANTTIIEAKANITLTSNAFTSIIFTWNTAGFVKGNYTIWAYASPIPNETDTIDNTKTADNEVKIGVIGDLNNDNKCNILDLVKEAGKFGAEKGDPHSPPAPKYDPNYDFNDDNKINILDLVKVAGYFGTTDP